MLWISILVCLLRRSAPPDCLAVCLRLGVRAFLTGGAFSCYTLHGPDVAKMPPRSHPPTPNHPPPPCVTSPGNGQAINATNHIIVNVIFFFFLGGALLGSSQAPDPGKTAAHRYGLRERRGNGGWPACTAFIFLQACCCGAAHTPSSVLWWSRGSVFPGAPLLADTI